MESKGLDVRGMDPWGLRRVEQLLHTVEGVDSLKIVPDGHGSIDEIHVLSSSGLGAKQIVRNIESALLAQFGLQVDHRKISIAQVRAQDIEPLIQAEEPEEELPPGSQRLVLDTFHLERRAGERVVCRVELLNGDSTYLGQAEGPDYSKSRMEVAARAVLDALSKTAEGTRSFGMEGVTQVNLFGREMIVVAVQGFEGRGRSPITLLGIAEVRDSVEESVVYACLSATNRWTADS
jgi:hypothetical protein